MATCALNPEQIDLLYKLTILSMQGAADRGESFGNESIKSLMTQVYSMVRKSTNDPVKGALFAQAIPAIVSKIQLSKEKSRILTQVNFDPAKFETLKNSVVNNKDGLLETFKFIGITQTTASTKGSTAPPPTTITTSTPWDSLPQDLKDILQPLWDAYITSPTFINTFGYYNKLTDVRKLAVRADWLKTQGKVINDYNAKTPTAAAATTPQTLQTYPQIVLNDKINIVQLQTLLRTLNAAYKQAVNKNQVSLISKYESDIKILEDFIKNREAQKAAAFPLSTILNQIENALTAVRNLFKGKDAAEYDVAGSKMQRVTRLASEVLKNRFKMVFDQKGSTETTVGIQSRLGSDIKSYDDFVREFSNKNFLPVIMRYNPVNNEPIENLVFKMFKEFSDNRKQRFFNAVKRQVFDNKFYDPNDVAKTKGPAATRIVSILVDMLYEESSTAGTVTDEVIRTILDGQEVDLNSEIQIYRDEPKVKLGDYISEAAVQDIKMLLAPIIQSINRGEMQVISAHNIIFDPAGKRAAGEFDLLLLDKDGNIKILDIKTSLEEKWKSFGKVLPEKLRRGKKYKDAPADAAFYFNDKIVRYTLQQLLYKNMFFNMFGVDVNISLLPISLEYGKDGEVKSVKLTDDLLGISPSDAKIKTDFELDPDLLVYDPNLKQNVKLSDVANELIPRVPPAIKLGEAGFVLPGTATAPAPAPTPSSTASTAPVSNIEAEKQKITPTEFKEVVRLAKYFLENPKEPGVKGDARSKYPELFNAITDIEKRREETIASIKEGYNGGKTWEYIGQFSDQATKFTNYELFQNEYTKEQVIDEINAKYDTELAALEGTTTPQPSSEESNKRDLAITQYQSLNPGVEDAAIEEVLAELEKDPTTEFEDVDAYEVYEKLSNNEYVPLAQIVKASDAVYSVIKKLRALNNDPERLLTTSQIQALRDMLDPMLDLLETTVQSLEEVTEEEFVEEEVTEVIPDKLKGDTIGDNAGLNVLYQGGVGEIIQTDDGTYVFFDFELNRAKVLTDDPNMSLDELGIEAIEKGDSVFGTQIVENQKFTVSQIEDNTITINGVDYTVVRDNSGKVQSLRFKTNQKTIDRLTEQVEKLEKDINTQVQATAREKEAYNALSQAEKREKVLGGYSLGALDLKLNQMRSELSRLETQLLKARSTNFDVETKNSTLIGLTNQSYSEIKKTISKDPVVVIEAMSDIDSNGTEAMSQFFDDTFPTDSFEKLFTATVDDIKQTDIESVIKWLRATIEKIEDTLEGQDLTTRERLESLKNVFNSLANNLVKIQYTKNGKITKRGKVSTGVVEQVRQSLPQFAGVISDDASVSPGTAPTGAPESTGKTGTTTEEIEAKKADIERRRQEDFKNQGFALSPESSATEGPYRIKIDKSGEAIISDPVDNPEGIGLKEWLDAQGITKVEEGLADWKRELAYIQFEVIDKINAKYDAELAALKDTQQQGSVKTFNNLKRGDIIVFQLEEYQVERVTENSIEVINTKTGDTDVISKEDYNTELDALEGVEVDETEGVDTDTETNVFNNLKSEIESASIDELSDKNFEYQITKAQTDDDITLEQAEELNALLESRKASATNPVTKTNVAVGDVLVEKGFTVLNTGKLWRVTRVTKDKITLKPVLGGKTTKTVDKNQINELYPEKYSAEKAKTLSEIKISQEDIGYMQDTVKALEALNTTELTNETLNEIKESDINDLLSTLADNSKTCEP